MSVKINLNTLSDQNINSFNQQLILLTQLMQKGGKLSVLTDSQGRHLICEELSRIDKIAKESITSELESDDLRSLLLRARELNLMLDLTHIRDVFNRILDEKAKYFPNQMTEEVLQKILSFMDIRDLFSFGLADLYANEVIREIKRRDPNLVENESHEQTPEQKILKAKEKWGKLAPENMNNIFLARSAMKVRDRLGLDFFAYTFESSILQDY